MSDTTELRYQREKLERQIEQARRQRSFGLLGVLLGLGLAIPLPPLGLLLLLAGLLAAVTQHLKATRAQGDLDAIQARLQRPNWD